MGCRAIESRRGTSDGVAVVILGRGHAGLCFTPPHPWHRGVKYQIGAIF